MIEPIIFLLIFDLCKYFRLTSAIVLGDETPDNLVPAFRRTSIKGITKTHKDANFKIV